ncbi:MAG: hypothetical protein RLZZ76_18 [Candidatus Parcubacteria bacterium]|jgi:hypothetical protein
MKKSIVGDEVVSLKIQKSQARFKRIKNEGPDTGIGFYFLALEVTALKGAVLVPLSIASGKKVAGFVYQIEGTGAGTLSKASVEVRGEGVTQVTLGTLLFAKIPEGKKAVFRIQIETRGKIGKEYTVLIHQLNYKQSPTDARYKKFSGEIRTRTLEFK